jgi:hypothetical protein
MEEEKDQFELAEAILSGDLSEPDYEDEYYEEDEDMPCNGEDFDEAERILKGEDEFSTAEAILNPTGSQNTSKVMKAVLVVPGSSVFNDLFILGEI